MSSHTNLLVRYLNVRFSLLQLRTFEAVAKSVAELSRLVIIFFFALFAYVLLTLALIELYVEKVGPRSEGFLIVGVFNVILLILLIVAKNQIFVNPLSNMVEKILFESTDQFEKQLEAVKDEKTWLKIKLLKMKFAEESLAIEKEFLQFTEWEYWQVQLYNQARNMFTYHRAMRWIRVLWHRYRRKSKVVK